MDVDLSFNIILQTDTKIEFESASPANDFGRGQFGHITLIKQNGDWILENYSRSFSKIDLLI
jgi:hypothetical protein